jgi:PAS domain S-box-containing protein
MHAPRITQRQNTELYRLLVESVRDYAIFVLDPGGHVASWNEGAQRIKGYSADEIIGRHFSTFYPDSDNAWGKPGWELQVAEEHGRFEDEGWRIRRDGTRFWANVVITALRDESRQLVGFAKVTRDLTERREAEQRAIADARRIAEAEGANRAKSEFLAVMSHELRTPLNAIGGYVELLQLGIGGTLSAQQQEYLARVRSSQQHLLGIISDLLNYSRIEAGQLSYDLRELDARSLLDDVVPLVVPQAATRGLLLTRGGDPGPALVRADRTKAEQVLLNLLSNAVKFTPAGGRVAVDCVVNGTHALVTVRDTGPGIPETHRESVFEPFVQVGRHLSGAYEGTGLGLAISRDMARGMGGDVTLESTMGEGSAFTFALPLAQRQT